MRALENANQDVVAISRVSPGASDESIIKRAASESRILLTEDKDFGQLARAMSRNKVGVVLIRFPAKARASLGPSVEALLDEQGPRLPGSFTVLQPGRVRITSIGG